MSDSMQTSFNSSITRVRPVFQRLIRRDATGRSWLPTVLRLASHNQAYATSLATDCGDLLPWVIERRPFDDRVLKRQGVPGLYLERCFEYDLPPPADFLRWLIHNPDRLTWPNEGRSKFGTSTQRAREELLRMRGAAASFEARRKALVELDQMGPKGSRRRWWAFEGFTSADCYLETDKLVLVIEGKRLESVSSKVQWYPIRNQLVRNLETTSQVAAGKNFVILAVGEEAIDDVDPRELTASLPHLTPNQRDELWSHYLGHTTWEAVCQNTGIDHALLPDTVDKAIGDLKKSGYLTA